MMKICPWMESDQKCWKGDFTEAFLGVVVYGAEREVPVLEVEQGAPCVGYGLRPATGREHEEGRNGGTRDNHGGYG